MCGRPSSEGKVLGKRLNQSQGKNPRTKLGVATTVVRCGHCDLIYSNPMPVPESIQDHYGVPPEDYWKNGNYFVMDEGHYGTEIARLKRLISIRPGARSLDVGAGIGKVMIALSRAGFDAFGIEASKPFYEKAITMMGIRPERLRLTSIENADFEEASFEYISFGAVLEHFQDPSGSIKKALGWLKPGGIIHIEVPSSNWLVSRLANLYYRLIGTDYVANICPMHIPYHLYEFGLKSFQYHSEASGYEIAAFTYYVTDTHLLPNWLGVFIIPLMKHTNTGSMLDVWLRKRNPASCSPGVT